MVSRQETARPLLTPGEVMQLPPADEIVLVSGIAPIRAKKLRYYEDENFTARVFAAPALSEGRFLDRPAPRPDDWGLEVRNLHADLEAAAAENVGESEDEGGLQRQLHPGLGGKVVEKPLSPETTVDLGIDDEGDPATDASILSKAYAMNEGDLHRDPGRDLLPQF